MTTSRIWRPKPRPRSALLARIDPTPVLAIFLVFLWLFMFPGAVVIDRKGRQVDLAYAESATPKPSALREDSLHLTVTRTGALFIPGNNYYSGGPVSRDDLPRVFGSMMRPEVERRVYVSADARAKYGDVKVALAAIRESGISDITLLMERGPLPASMQR